MQTLNLTKEEVELLIYVSELKALGEKMKDFLEQQ